MFPFIPPLTSIHFLSISTCIYFQAPLHICPPTSNPTRFLHTSKVFQHKRINIHSLNPCHYFISYHLPVEGPKPHTHCYLNPIACLKGLKPQLLNLPFACQGAEALHLLLPTAKSTIAHQGAEALHPLSPIAKPVAAYQGAKTLHPSLSHVTKAITACQGAETLHLSLSPSLLPLPPRIMKIMKFRRS